MVDISDQTPLIPFRDAHAPPTIHDVSADVFHNDDGTYQINLVWDAASGEVGMTILLSAEEAAEWARNLRV